MSPVPSATRDQFQGYSFALAAVALVVLLRWALPGILSQTPFLAFYPAVMLAAIVGGTGPGVFATLASAACIGVLFDTTPGWEHLDEPAVLVRLGLFLVGGIGTSLAAGIIRASQTHARQQAEAMRASEQFNRSLVDSSIDCIKTLDLEGKLLSMSDGGQKLLEIADIHRYLNRCWSDFWQEEDRPRVREAVAAARDGGVGRFQAFCTSEQGNPRWWDVIVTPIPGPDGKVQRLLAVSREISPQKQAEAALRQSEQRLRATFNNAALGIVEVADDDRIIDANERMCRILGYRCDELLGKSIHELTAAEDRQQSDDLNAQLHAGRRDRVDYEKRYLRRDGTPLWVRVAVTALRDAAGRWVGAIGTVEDIQQRKMAEEALRESEQRVRRKLDALLLPEGDIGELELADIIDVPAIQALVNEAYKLMHIPMAIIDLQGRVLVGVGWQQICTEFHRRHPETCQYCIESDTQLTMGVAPGEFRLYRCKNSMWDIATPILIGGKHVGNLFTGQFFFDDEQVDREAFRTQARRYGFDEEQYLVALDAVPRLSREAVRTGMTFFIRLAGMLSQLSYSNIKLARSSEALAAAKLSAERARHTAEEANRAKDQFLAVLSHELRTPLTPVVAAVSMLQEGVEDEQTARDALEIIHRNVEMEARLIDDLLDVTRIVRGKIELTRQPTMLCEVIHRAVEVCRPDIETRQIHFGLDLGASAPYLISADAARLQQVFWNLLKNAVKFTPHGGCIGIRCTREDGHVVAEVTDSGEGIDPVLLPSIFNPFEQGGARVTRQFGGLGLGLTITKGVVELHGGTIEAHSAGKGKGATFRVRLPLCVAPELASVQVPAAPAGSARPMANDQRPMTPLRILLVEDHGDTARVMRRLLTSRGYDVEIAGDVASALELAQQQSFDLLLSDLGLPDGSGMDLMRTLRQHGRTIPAIALSGYGQGEDIRRSKEAGFAAHLTKPTNPDQLVKTIGAVAHPGATN